MATSRIRAREPRGAHLALVASAGEDERAGEGARTGERVRAGSTVIVEDTARGARESYTLVTGSVLDLNAGHVSLASPIGQALLGARAGDVVVARTPRRTRTLHVIAVHAPCGGADEAQSP